MTCARAARAARVIGLEHPEAKGSFRFSGGNVADRTLLASARAFAGEALPLKAALLAAWESAGRLERAPLTQGDGEQPQAPEGRA